MCEPWRDPSRWNRLKCRTGRCSSGCRRIRLKKVAQTENTENDFRDADVKETLRKEAFKRIRLSENAKGDIALSALWLKASKRMSAVAGMIRSRAQMEKALEETSEDVKNFEKKVCTPSVSQLQCFTSCMICSFPRKFICLPCWITQSRRSKQGFCIIYRSGR